MSAVERLLNDVERWDGKRFQHFIQQNFASGLVISFGPRSTRETHTRTPFEMTEWITRMFPTVRSSGSLLAVFVAFEVLTDEDEKPGRDETRQ